MKIKFPILNLDFIPISNPHPNSKCRQMILGNIYSVERPHGACAFDGLRKYQPIQIGPKKIHFGKTHFSDPNYDTQIC